MSDWLRHFQKPFKAPAPDARATRSQENVSTPNRPLGLFRPSSYTSLASAASEYSPSINGPIVPDQDAERSSSPETGPYYDAQPSPTEMQDLWHRPTIQQIIDALYAIMMTKSVNAPLPVEYNVYIQHLLEGYANLSRALRDMEELVAEEKETKLRSMEEFTKMTQDWEQKDADYRAEIRRMEVLLAHSVPEGVEAVILARSGSVVDRSLAESRRFRARVSKARGEASAATEDYEDDFNKTTSSGCRSIVDSPNKPSQRSHKTILTMRRSVNHHADEALSEKMRHLLSRGNERRSPSARRRGPAGEENTVDRQGHGSHAGNNKGIIQQAPFDPRSAVPGQKDVNHSAARSTTDQVSDMPSPGNPEMETMERASKRGHRRRFSFDPGEDELSLPNLFGRRAPGIEGYKLGRLSEAASSMDVACNLSEPQTAATPQGRLTSIESDNTSGAECILARQGDSEATLATQVGMVSHDSTSSRITAIRVPTPTPTSDERADAHANSDSSPSCLGSTAGSGMVWSARGDRMDMEEARRVTKSVLLDEVGLAALAAQRAMARDRSRDGPALLRRSESTSGHHES